MRSLNELTKPIPLPPRQKVPLRTRRRRTRLALALAALALLGFLIWLVSYVSYLPRFNISSITVSGTQLVAPTDVQSFAEGELQSTGHPFLSPRNIFLYHPRHMGTAIVAAFPRIKSVQVGRDSLFATDVHIAVVERQSFALWCTSETDCYQMDDSGFIFASVAQDASSTLQFATSYLFEGGIASSSGPVGQSFAPAHVPGILVLLQKLSQAGFPSHGAVVINDSDFSIPLTLGFYLKASFGEGADMLVKNLQLVLSSDALQGKAGQLQYVDLRFGDKVYYKLNGGNETTAPPQ